MSQDIDLDSKRAHPLWCVMNTKNDEGHCLKHDVYLVNSALCKEMRTCIYRMENDEILKQYFEWDEGE